LALPTQCSLPNSSEQPGGFGSRAVLLIRCRCRLMASAGLRSNALRTIRRRVRRPTAGDDARPLRMPAGRRNCVRSHRTKRNSRRCGGGARPPRRRL